MEGRVSTGGGAKTEMARSQYSCIVCSPACNNIPTRGVKKHQLSTTREQVFPQRASLCV